MAEEAGGEQGREQGRWRRGQSGNPAGRPRGSRNRTTVLCGELLAGNAEDIIAKLVERAKAGDAVALKLCVERLIPLRAARDRTVDVELPDVGAVRDLVAAAAAVVEHAAAGRITLSEAREFMGLLEGQRKLVETAELAARIEGLEDGRLQDQVVRGLDGLAPELRARVRVLGAERAEVKR